MTPEMGRLFEAFVRGFLRLERPELRVHRQNKRIYWNAGGREGPQVPVMEADIFVPAQEGCSVIVEAKCEASPFDRAGKTLKSRHLYQLWAYLTNYARAHEAEPPPLGVLLYATQGESFRYTYELPGHPLNVRSLALDRPWPKLRRDLLRLAEELAEATGARMRSVA